MIMYVGLCCNCYQFSYIKMYIFVRIVYPDIHAVVGVHKTDVKESNIHVLLHLFFCISWPNIITIVLRSKNIAHNIKMIFFETQYINIRGRN